MKSQKIKTFVSLSNLTVFQMYVMLTNALGASLMAALKEVVASVSLHMKLSFINSFAANERILPKL